MGRRNVPRHYDGEKYAIQISKGSSNFPWRQIKSGRHGKEGGEGREKREELGELSRNGEISSQREVENHAQTKPTQPHTLIDHSINCRVYFSKVAISSGKREDSQKAATEWHHRKRVGQKG